MHQQQAHTRPYSLPHTAPSKSAILQWVTSLLPDLASCTIEQLGDGQAYCRIINCYAPGSVVPARIVFSPKNQYESALNLKQLQTALTKLRINLPFDIHRVAKKKFNQNWALVSQLYRALHAQETLNSTDSEGKKEGEVPNKPTTNRRQTEIPNKVSMIEASSSCKLSDFPTGSLLFTVDRVKEVLLGRTHDTEKLRQIRVLFGLEKNVKVEEGEGDSVYRFDK